MPTCAGRGPNWNAAPAVALSDPDMTSKRGTATGIVIGVLLAFVPMGIWWMLTRPAPEAAKVSVPPIPATIPKPAKEEQFNTVILTDDAIKSLALKTEKSRIGKWQRSRLYGGDITIPPGQSIIVSAPFSAILEATGKTVPRVGSLVSRGTPLFQLLPLLTPEGKANLAAAKVDADGQFRNAETQEAAAARNLVRARMLLADDVGSKQRVDDAEAAHDIATRTFEAAKLRVALLTKLAGQVEDGTAGPIPVEAPASGILRHVAVAHGQPVPTGAVLFEVADLSQVWVRVPVYASERTDIASELPAAVGSLSPRPNEKPAAAEWIEAPPSANALTGTVDIYLQLKNPAGRFSPGERVGVTLPLHGKDDCLIVPRAAILYDIHGNTWVYERTAERTFIRRRVVLREMRGPDAFLAEGPAAGAEIVTDGAIELFGTETGYSK